MTPFVCFLIGVQIGFVGSVFLLAMIGIAWGKKQTAEVPRGTLQDGDLAPKKGSAQTSAPLLSGRAKDLHGAIRNGLCCEQCHRELMLQVVLTGRQIPAAEYCRIEHWY